MVQRLRGVTVTQRLIALALLALLPAFGVILYHIIALYQDRQRDAYAIAARYGQMTSLEMQRIVSGVEGVLHVLAHAPIVRNFQRDPCNQLLREVADGLPQLLAIVVVDAEGQVRCSVPATDEPANVADRRYFQEAKESRGMSIGTFTRSRVQDTPSIPLVVPIRDGADQFAGAIVTGFDLGWLGEQLRQRTLRDGDSLTIADREGTIVAREPYPERFIGVRIPESFQHLLQAAGPGVFEASGPDDTPRIIGYAPPAYTGIGLYVSYGVSREAAFASLNSATLRSIVIALVAGAGLFLVAWATGVRLFHRPIAQMLATIEAWRRGDQTARTGVRGGQGELAMLAAAIDDYMEEVVSDRAARRRAEGHRDLLVRELEHRVRNILATAQAIAKQSFRHSEDREALQAFSARLAAMATANEMLAKEDWSNADLRRTLEQAIKPFQGSDQSRFTLSGPAVTVAARAAMALSMAMHELCTNAVKYGALSQPGGQVAISWGFDGEPGDRAFFLCWKETGGPQVAPTDRKGFGTSMLQRVLAAEMSADVTIDFAPTGLVCTVRCLATSPLFEVPDMERQPELLDSAG